MIAGLIPLVVSAGSIIDPPLVGILTVGAQAVTDGLLALKKVFDNYNNNPSDDTLTKVQNAFTDVQSNLIQLESAAKIKDVILQTKIKAIITSVIQGLALIESTILHKHVETVAAFNARNQ